MRPGSETSLAPLAEASKLTRLRMGGHRGERVGEAKSPGPRPCLQGTSALRVFVLNTGGAPGAWRLYDSDFLQAQVVCIQELGMSDREFEGYAKAVKAKGFVAYYTPGPVTQGRGSKKHYKGGVATLVHQTVRHTQGGSVQLEDCQVQGVWLGNLHLVNVYSPPDCEGVTAEALGQFWAREGLDRGSWLVAGDFNEVPEDSLVHTVLTAHGGNYVGPTVPTRWQGDRCIDWAVASSTQVECLGIEDSERFSDHHGFWLRAPNQTVTRWKGRLKQAPAWTKPPALSQQDWRKELERAWEGVCRSADFASLNVLFAQPPNPDYVQEEWDVFMSCLNRCFLSALGNLAVRQDEVGAFAKQALKQPGLSAKGRPGIFQWIPETLNCSGDPQPGEQLRKIRRRLARLYELRRLLANGKPAPPALLKRIWASGSTVASLEVCLHEIDRVKAEQQSLELKQKQRRLRCWKERICQGTFAGLGAWLRSKQSSTRQVTLCRNGLTAQNKDQAADMIAQHWQEVWDEVPVNEAEAIETLVKGFGEVEPTSWTGLTVQEIHRAMSTAKGTGGPDNWSAAEVKHLPERVAEVFKTLSDRWGSTGRLPLQLKQVRQVNLAKPNKLAPDGTLEAKHTRPIAIYSIFWRIFASAWSKNRQLQDWASRHFHPSVSFGAGSASAEVSAARLQDAFARKGGYLATMDWSSAYDRMRPSISAAAFRQLGLPEPLAKLVLEAWSNQARWVSWAGHTRQTELLASSATPQGCPLAPFCLSLWVSSGVRHVESTMTDRHAVLSSYMDDRSWHTTSWEGVSNRIQRWGAWSRVMGLKEAPDKIQVCARHKVFKQILCLNGHQDWIKSDIRFLGAHSVSERRKYGEVEQTRLSAAERQAALLSTTGMPWDRMILAHRAFVVNKAAFGWVGRFPTQHSSEKLFSLLSRSFRSGHFAARALRKLLYGGAVLLNSIVLSQAWKRLRTDRGLGLQNQWHNAAHSAVGLIRRGLKKLGFTEQEPWLWRVPSPWYREVPVTEQSLDLRDGSRQPQDLQLHVIRSQARRGWFEDYIDSGRHETEEMLRNYSRPRLRRAFLEVDLKKTRQLLSLGPHYRAACLASAFSPMHLHAAGKQGETGACPFCGNLVGSWAHVTWHCKNNPSGGSVPSNPLAKRLGWVALGSGKEPGNHIAETIAKLWVHRHGSQPPRASVTS